MKDNGPEEIPFEEPAPFKVTILYPEGPIKWEGFTKFGGYLRIYENGCRTYLSKAVIEDDRLSNLNSPGT